MILWCDCGPDVVCDYCWAVSLDRENTALKGEVIALRANNARLREALVVAHQFAYDVQEWADDEHVFEWDDGSESVQDRAVEAERAARSALATGGGK